ncbi:helix-turn-helix domain-containing protein [Arthrobacter cavernae]|uniref:LysR family transcriptional regulator n=1 Tax=Arthrobacter cavernae TaxID=2817681 RepID=A0A939HBA0_9MICC|nr:LysR family transcriptional regulator [Arthrobacter cavernae]MBO1267737.1 LysR family transcriptional regulator [Arthrobacter cavernae]
MRFAQLRYLEAALRTGSFRQAAKELDISQPTITNQVQRLEEDLGVILVTRGAKGVRPTYAATGYCRTLSLRSRPRKCCAPKPAPSAA